MLSVVPLVIFAAIILLHYAIKFSRKGVMLRRVRGPPAMPIFGHALDFLCSPIEIFYMGRSFARTYKDMYMLWFFHVPILNIFHPDDVEVVLSSPKYTSKSDGYKFLQPWLGDGLLTSGGLKWKSRRKMLTPTFHFNILRQFCDVLGEQSENLVKRLSNQIESEVEIFQHISNFSLRVICETAMGIRLDDLPDMESNAYIHNIQEISKLIVHRNMRIWQYSEWTFSLSDCYRQQKRVLRVLRKFTDDVIAQRARTTVDDFNPEEGRYGQGDQVGRKRPAMLDLLLSLEKRGEIDRQGIREEVDTFLFEGHDTTTTGLTCLLMELANNKSIQKKVVEEIDELFTESDALTMEMMNKMTYLDRCIKEALRLYPSAAFIGRKISEDMKLKKHLIPAGTTIHIHIFDLHRRPEIYPDPDRFDPDRFLPENMAGRHPFAYVPFSAGPRNCIGQKFAILELKAVVSTILRHFKLEPVTKPDRVLFKADIVLKSETPIKIKFVHRNSNSENVKDLMMM